MKQEEINFECLAKCCGQSPQYNPRGSGFFCEVCNRKHFGIGGGIEWQASLWNIQFHKAVSTGGYGTDQSFVTDYQTPPILHSDGWKFAKVRMSFHLPWQEERIRNHDFVLFQCPDRTDDSLLKSEEGYEYVIDDYRHLHKIRLMSLDGKICELDLPTFKGQCSVYADLNRSWCTDGTWNYLLNINTLNHKWREAMAKSLAEIGITFPDWR